MFLRVPKTIIREGGTSQYLLYAKKRKNIESRIVVKLIYHYLAECVHTPYTKN